MAKKPSRQKRNVSEMAPTDSTLPYIMQIDRKEWHEFEFNLDSLLKHDDGGGPDEDWSRYTVEAVHAEEAVRDDFLDDTDATDSIEIPFWAMKAFWEAILEAYTAGEDEIKLEVKLTQDRDGQNEINFREVAA